MPRVNTAILAFNRGIISPLALARVDLDRLQFSAETQTNWMPRVLGSMMLRPGLQYIYTLPSKAMHIPFLAAIDNTAIIELSDGLMRVSVDEEIITRPAVTAAITNGTFLTDLTGWTDTDEGSAASTWATGGYLSLLGTGTSAAKRNQLVTVVETGVVHALRVEVRRGPVLIKVGVTAGDDTYVSATLKTGTHSLAFTPTGNFYIEFSSSLDYSVIVDSVAIESSGVMEISTPWVEADLGLIRKSQSADVIFIACDGYQQRRIERRDNNSWSIVLEEPLDGPFKQINVSSISITPSALTGDITLTASKALFKGSSSEHSGTLYKLSSSGQVVQTSVTAEDMFTGSILVTGIGDSREFRISIAGSWSATVRLQRSVDDATWVDVESYTSNKNEAFNDELDNVEYFYRLGVKVGEFTSGSVELGISYSGGTLTGVVKVRSVSSPTSASATVITPLGGTDATRDWQEGVWDAYQGFPTAVSLYEGRVWYAGRGNIWGSVSDAYSSFDTDQVGVSTSIGRNLGEGAVDIVHWLVAMQRLIIGTSGNEISVRSSSFDEPLTYLNFNTKDASTKGSANVDIVKDGQRAIFVQRSGSSVYQMQYSLEVNDYTPANLSELCPEVTEPSIVRMAIQQEPDTRVHCVRSDGKAAVLVKDEAENTLAWIIVETDGVIEDAFVLPGNTEDKVYYAVKRTIDGVDVRYLERWALESEGRGGTSNKLADSFIYESGVSKSVIDGLEHLEGETVVLWGNAKDLGSYVVSGGEITPSETVTSYCVGLPYNAVFKSAKLAYASGMGTALGQTKKVVQIGVVARDLHASGITYGPSEGEQYDLPRVHEFDSVDDDYIYSEYDAGTASFGGHWDADSRLVIKASSPKPATILAAIIGVQTNDKS
jgi:hypothetical protein